jgi:hypothetical protein
VIENNTDLQTKSCLVYDHGLFVELAARLARDFGRVYYYNPWQINYPKESAALVGNDLDGVIVENPLDKNVFELISIVDIVIFPDVHDGGLQTYLRSQGVNVWGSGEGEILELDRWLTKELLRIYGLPVAKAKKITGLDNLKNYLKDHKDKYIKTPIWRGDMETFHFVDSAMASPWFDELGHTLGASKQKKEFIAEDSIPGVEIGYDGYFIDKDFPNVATFGYEIKDEGFIGQAREYAYFPKILKDVNKNFIKPVLENFRYRNFISSEIRIGKDLTPYLIDPCCRMASPPGEIVLEWFENISNIIWYGAHGVLIDPIITKKYGVSLMFNSDWAKTNWLEVRFPKELRQWVKLRNATQIDNRYYIIPQVVTSGIGSVIAIEDSLQDAIETCRERAKEITAYNMSYNPDVLNDALETIEQGQKVGIDW